MRYDISWQQNKRIDVSAEKAGAGFGGPKCKQRQWNHKVNKMCVFVDAKKHNPSENGTDKEAANIEAKERKTYKYRPANKDSGGTAKYLREYRKQFFLGLEFVLWCLQLWLEKVTEEPKYGQADT